MARKEYESLQASNSKEHLWTVKSVKVALDVCSREVTVVCVILGEHSIAAYGAYSILFQGMVLLAAIQLISAMFPMHAIQRPVPVRWSWAMLHINVFANKVSKLRQVSTDTTHVKVIIDFKHTSQTCYLWYPWLISFNVELKQCTLYR